VGGAAQPVRRVAGAFQGLPRYLQNESLLRVQRRSFARSDPEEDRVELVDPSMNPPYCGDILAAAVGSGARIPRVPNAPGNLPDASRRSRAIAKLLGEFAPPGKRQLIPYDGRWAPSVPSRSASSRGLHALDRVQRGFEQSTVIPSLRAGILRTIVSAHRLIQFLSRRDGSSVPRLSPSAPLMDS